MFTSYTATLHLSVNGNLAHTPILSFIKFVSSKKVECSTTIQLVMTTSVIEKPQKGKRTYDSRVRGVSELFWVSVYDHLLVRGYKLRPRYHPEWTPSWGLEYPDPPKDETEDSHGLWYAAVIDATRLKDKTKVVIKRVSDKEASHLMFLNAQESGSDSNRTVPLLDIFPVPLSDGEVFIVMPMLYIFDRLPFRRLGEIIEAAHQFLKGLAFMHNLNVAHRDACQLNMCMDVTKMIPKGFHLIVPRSHNGVRDSKFRWRERWSVKPIQYFFIDFGLSSRYPPDQKNIRDIGIVGQDKTVPERSLKVPYDPFKMDVYQLGNALKDAMTKYEGLESFEPLLNSMTMTDPALRPTAGDALKLFEQSISGFKKADLKRRIWLKDTEPRLRSRIKYWGWNPWHA